MPAPRKLLVLDASYAWEAIQDRGLQHSVTCRDLDGFFEHVWTVHPFGALVETRSNKVGAPEEHAPAAAHTFVNGKVGRFDALKRFPKLNFAVGQASLLFDLARLVKREEISAIRGGDALFIGFVGLALARVTGVPFVVRVNAIVARSH